MGQVIVGVDESEGAARALRWAADEAARRGWTLSAVLAWGYLDQHWADGAPPHFEASYGEADARQALDQIVRGVLGDTSGVELRTVCDLPARALVEAASGGDLLVLGARGLGGFRGLLLGSVSQAVLHHATVPVAVVRESRERPPGQPERIVAAFDGSEQARHAVRFALDEGRARQAEVVVVHAWHPVYLAMSPARALERYEEESRRLLDSALEGADLSGLPAPVERISRGGPPASVILEQAADADLVVMGSRGRGGFRGLLLGSVASQVSHYASCPVVVVPGSGQ